MASILSLDRITKYYGSLCALDQVSFEVPAGSIFGILGPNGSGKTTLLGIVTDVKKADSGSFLLFGETPSEKHRQHIGALLETPNFYHYLSGEDNLAIAAEIKERGRSDIPKVLQQVGLLDRRKSKFSTYSLGMKQRLAIAAALLGDPEVLILDEPTNGLDPAGIAEIRELINGLAKAGKTAIIASHLLDEVEKVCTHVAILKKGSLLTTGPVNEVLVNEDLVEMGAADIDQLSAVIRQYPAFRSLRRQGALIQVRFDRDIRPDEINRFCFEHGVALDQLKLKKKSLETTFIELTERA